MQRASFAECRQANAFLNGYGVFPYIFYRVSRQTFQTRVILTPAPLSRAAS